MNIGTDMDEKSEMKNDAIAIVIFIFYNITFIKGE